MNLPRLAVVLLALLLAAPAPAQRFAPADSAEIAHHLLTEAEIARTADVVAGMDSIYRTDRNAFAGIRSGVQEPYTLAALGERQESSPALRTLLARAGIRGRDFVLTLMAIVDARGAAMVDAADQDAITPVRRENLRLVAANRETITRMLTLLRTLTPG